MPTRLRSVRRLSADTGVCRDVYLREIHAGRLRATRISAHRFGVADEDYEEWRHSRPVVPTDSAQRIEERVEELLAQDEARSASGP